MSDSAREMIELYRASDLPEAHALRLQLQEAGIHSVIDNELLQGAVGAAPMGWVTAPRIMVHPTNEAAARGLLALFLQQPKTSTVDDSVRCLACNSPLGSAEVCPRCGWTYKTEEPDEPPEPSTPSNDIESSEKPSWGVPEPKLPRATVWWEILAVLSIGVFPGVIASITSLFEGQPGSVYWLDSLWLFGSSACVVCAILFIMHRSGEDWATFGIRRPIKWDIVIGVGTVVAADVLWRLVSRIPIRDLRPETSLFPLPKTTTDHIWMVLKFSMAGFSEELVTRCYLITRFRQQIRRPIVAVLLAATCFASFHLYQGPRGVIWTFLFGILYGLVFLARRSIWPLAIGHALGNMCIDLGI